MSHATAAAWPRARRAGGAGRRRSTAWNASPGDQRAAGPCCAVLQRHRARGERRPSPRARARCGRRQRRCDERAGAGGRWWSWIATGACACVGELTRLADQHLAGRLVWRAVGHEVHRARPRLGPANVVPVSPAAGSGVTRDGAGTVSRKRRPSASRVAARMFCFQPPRAAEPVHGAGASAAEWASPPSPAQAREREGWRRPRDGSSRRGIHPRRRIRYSRRREASAIAARLYFSR